MLSFKNEIDFKGIADAATESVKQTNMQKGFSDANISVKETIYLMYFILH